MRQGRLGQYLVLFCVWTAVAPACSGDRPEWNADEKVRGFNIFLWNSRNRFEAADFAANVARIRSLGANTIFLCPYYFVSNASASRVFAGPDTVSDADLSNALFIVRSNGLQAGLKPHIDILDGTPRYQWQPADPATAQTSYVQYISTYAKMSAAQDVRYFIIGTELDNQVETPGFFEAVISAVRSSFTGHVTYAASYNQFAVVPFWDQCDSLGVNAWFFLSEARTPDREQVLVAWQDWNRLLNYFSGYYDKPVFLTELGYYNADYPACNPGDWSSLGTRNDRAQANCVYAALHNYDQQANYTGLAIWNWELNLTNNTGVDYTPMDLEAETVIREMWNDVDP